MSVAPLQRTASAEDVRRWLRSFLSPEESMLICAYHFDAKTLFEANDLGTLGSFLCKAVNIPANVALKIVNRLTESLHPTPLPVLPSKRLDAVSEEMQETPQRKEKQDKQDKRSPKRASPAAAGSEQKPKTPKKQHQRSPSSVKSSSVTIRLMMHPIQASDAALAAQLRAQIKPPFPDVIKKAGAVDFTQQGVAAISIKRHSAAAQTLRAYEELRRSGNATPDELFALGFCHLHGVGIASEHGIQVSDGKAALREAARQGHLGAHNTIADLYWAKGNRDKAVAHWRAAADGGHEQARQRLTRSDVIGDDVSGAPDASSERLEAPLSPAEDTQPAPRSPSPPPPMPSLADLHSKYETAVSHALWGLEPLPDAANAERIFVLLNEVVAGAESLAPEWLSEAQYRLGVCYYEGVGTERNVDQALKLFKSAAADYSRDKPPPCKCET